MLDFLCVHIRFKFKIENWNLKIENRKKRKKEKGNLTSVMGRFHLLAHLHRNSHSPLEPTTAPALCARARPLPRRPTCLPLTFYLLTLAGGPRRSSHTPTLGSPTGGAWWSTPPSSSPPKQNPPPPPRGCWC